MKVDVITLDNKVKEQIELSQNIFGITPRKDILFRVVNWQLAKRRAGTHSTKVISEVSGTTKKPFAQKGTGRARQGSINAPQWRHGGIVFGPTPRSYAVKVNRKVAQLAMKSALSYKLANGSLVAVENIQLEEAKTKGFVQVLNNLNANTKALVVLNEVSDNVRKSSNNLPRVAVNASSHVSVYDVLNCDKLVLSLDSIKYFEEVLK